MDEVAGDDALTGVCYEQIESFLGEIGISAKLSDFGYQDEHMETIVKETMNAVQRKFNPRKPSEEDIAAIVKQLI
jgi:alcohol dehydrogenase class IV